MKTFMKVLCFFSTGVLLTPNALWASTQVKCDLQVQIGEDGGDRPIMKILASDTQDVKDGKSIQLQGQSTDGLSLFEVSVYAGVAIVELRDLQNSRNSFTRIRNVDLIGQKFYANAWIAPDGSKGPGMPSLVLLCIGN